MTTYVELVCDIRFDELPAQRVAQALQKLISEHFPERKTRLRLVTRNDTGWSSSFVVIQLEDVE